MDMLNKQIISDSEATSEPSLPEPPAPRRWEFRGKDAKLNAMMTPKLQVAQDALRQHGPGLANAFDLAYNPELENEVQFYDAGGNITAELLRRRRGGSTFAYTTPGSRAVMLPARDMAKMKQDEFNDLVLHEVMHSLGLPEDRGESDIVSSKVRKFMRRSR
jgi:hypothetical protein